MGQPIFLLQLPKFTSHNKDIFMLNFICNFAETYLIK